LRGNRSGDWDQTGGCREWERASFSAGCVVQLEPKKTVLVVAALAAVVAAWCGVDALIVTDEERLEQLVEDVTGPMDQERMTRALSWTDPSVEPVEVVAFGNTEVYTDGAELRARASQAVSRLSGDDLRVLRSSITVEGDVGTIALQLLSGRGMGNLEIRLRRHGDRWIVDRVRVQ